MNGEEKNERNGEVMMVNIIIGNSGRVLVYYFLIYLFCIYIYYYY